MYGLASLLPEPYFLQVKRIWDRLETCCGLTAIRATPYPHFSWQIAHSYPLDQFQSIVQQLSKHIAPFQVRTAGLGVFSGTTPIIFISVVKDPFLVTLHHQIWEQLAQIANEPNQYYHPAQWMPHITLAHEDVTPDNIGVVMQTLAFERYEWEMWIDNLALIWFADEEEPRGNARAAIRRYPLTAQSAT